MREYMLDSIYAGHGLLYLDPHGHDTDTLLQYIPRFRRRDVVLFDPASPHAIGWNPLADTPRDDEPFVASALTDAIKSAWGYADVTTPVLDMWLYYSLVTLMQAKRTLVDVPDLLTDRDTRTAITDKLTDTFVKDFWTVFDTMTGKEQRDTVASTLNKFYVLLGDPRIRHILSYSSFSMSDILKDKILLARLPQGQLGMGKTSLIGSLLLSQAHLSALRRTSSVPFHFYLDECHLWGEATLRELLSGIRKFNCRVMAAHQYVAQLPRPLFTALMGNTPVKHVFRVSSEDAELFQGKLGRNANHPDLDELRPLRYRTFPFDRYHGDDTVQFDDFPHCPTSARKIIGNMRRNYARTIPRD